MCHATVWPTRMVVGLGAYDELPRSPWIWMVTSDVVALGEEGEDEELQAAPNAAISTRVAIVNCRFMPAETAIRVPRVAAQKARDSRGHDTFVERAA